MIVWGANTLLCTAWSALWGKRSPGSRSSGFDVAKMLASVESPGAVRVGVLEEAVSFGADTEPDRQEGIGHRVVVHRSNSRSPSPGVNIRKPHMDPLFPET